MSAPPHRRKLSVPELNQRRHQAVSLRLRGDTLAAVSAETGLSAPTIIAAHKAYLKGGWAAVDTAPRGRPAAGNEFLSANAEAVLLDAMLSNAAKDSDSLPPLWSVDAATVWLRTTQSISAPDNALNKAVGRLVQRHHISAPALLTQARDSAAPSMQEWLANTYTALQRQARADSTLILWGGDRQLRSANSSSERELFQLYAHTTRGRQFWLPMRQRPDEHDWIRFLRGLSQLNPRGKAQLITLNPFLRRNPRISHWLSEHSQHIELIIAPAGDNAAEQPHRTAHTLPSPKIANHAMPLTHLQQLEAESIHIMREVVAEADNPVMLYSIGKDSAVMLRLAQKAFHPAIPPFPLLHVDTRWKFRDMYALRDRMAKELGMPLLVHINPDGVAKDINPFTHGSAIHTDIMKTEGLKQALDKYGFDAAFGGARRDEEKSRAKERIFSFRSAQHRWDPKHQRPELWRLYNTRKHKSESLRVFPLSNWTELDIWQYIYLENIPIVPLYYAAMRPVVERNGALIMVDDDRMPLNPGEIPMMKKVRFRTLGCYPLTGAIESDADTLPAIIREMLLSTTSERQGRVIDHDGAASMEKKKQEGYF